MEGASQQLHIISMAIVSEVISQLILSVHMKGFTRALSSWGHRLSG